MPQTRSARSPSTKTADIGKLLSACIHAAQNASAVINAVQLARMDGESINERYKDISDPRSALTRADQLAQSAILRPLLRDFPGLTIVAEEEVLAEDYIQEDSAGLSGDLCEIETPEHLREVGWEEICVFCDPVDGTLEFVKGRLESVHTLIGISVNGRAVGGVIGRPFVDGVVGGPGSMLYGIVGGGVAHVPEVKEEERGVVLATSRPKGEVVIDKVVGMIDAEEVLHLGGAGNKMLQLVSGAADVCVLNFITSLWDSAATEAVVVAAGGRVTDLFGNRIEHSATGRICNKYGVIGTGSKFSSRDKRHRTHDEVCAQLRKSMVLDGLLSDTGLDGKGEAQASDIARDLDGNPLTTEWLSAALGHEVVGFSAPESSAVRYLMSNACRLRIKYAEEGCKGPKSVFLKRAVMSELKHVEHKAATAPMKLGRDVKSYQVEAEFLVSESCRGLRENGVAIARAYHTDCRGMSDAIRSKFLLLIEDFDGERGWEQHGLLDEGKMVAVLDCLAAFHAYFWRSEAEDLNCVWGHGTYWAPDRQAGNSFEILEESWREHLERFEELLEVEGAERYGELLGKYAKRVADKVHGVGMEVGHGQRTIVHGDGKAANFMLKREEGEEGWRAGMIDLQWCGWGHVGTDVGYLMATSAERGALDGEEGLLRRYYEMWKGYMDKFGNKGDDEMAFEELVEMYEAALVDVARVVVSYHWRRIQVCADKLKSRREMIGSNSYNKDVSCAQWLVERTLKIMDDF